MKLDVSGSLPTFVCVQVPPDSDTEGKILQHIGDRLMRGYRQYGPFDSYKEGSKDWLEEALEELLDSTVYLTKRVLELQTAAVLANARQAAEAPLSGAAEDGRQVHCVGRAGTVWQGHDRSSEQPGGGTEGGGVAAESGG